MFKKILFCISISVLGGKTELAPENIAPPAIPQSMSGNVTQLAQPQPQIVYVQQPPATTRHSNEDDDDCCSCCKCCGTCCKKGCCCCGKACWGSRKIWCTAIATMALFIGFLQLYSRYIEPNMGSASNIFNQIFGVVKQS